MTKILKPIFEDGQDYFRSTGHRFHSLFRPIQETEYKESDWAAFVATPFIDGFVLEPMYALEASIHLLNAIASFSKALYLWTLNQQQSEHLLDHEARKEFNEALSQLTHACSAIAAQTFNTILSALAWITRPIVSLIEAADGYSVEQREGGQDRPQVYQHHQGYNPGFHQTAPVYPQYPPQYDQSQSYESRYNR